MRKIVTVYDSLIEKINTLDFLFLFLVRVYLAPIFIIAGLSKLRSFHDTVQWFGNNEWGLGLPFAPLLVVLVIIAELVGGFALLLGLFTRFFSASLCITMLVAAYKVHWQNGWFAIASTESSTSIASFWAAVGFENAKQSLLNTEQVAERLDVAREILRVHGDYEWLTQTGQFVILNNGIEFAITYFIILLPLLFYGAGRYLSVDYYLNRSIQRIRNAK